MKKERREFKRVEYKDVFIATDGAEFSSEDECKKYEGTCTCAINAMFNSLPHTRTWAGNSDCLFSIGYDDAVYAVKIRDLNDVEIVNKWLKAIDSDAKAIGTETIGTIQIFSAYDCYVNCFGTPDDLKKIYCDAIDALYDKLIKKSEEGEKA